jgi:uncharacterized membrane protein
MNLYSWIKLLHILSSSLLFGTSLGIAFFMLKAYLSQNTAAIKTTTSNAILADWIFTTPAVAVQLITGLWLSSQLGIAIDSPWFVAVILLFFFVGGSWLSVVWIQSRIHRVLLNGGQISDYRGLLTAWVLLGATTFAGVLVLFYLMVSMAGATPMVIQ